MQRRSSVFTGRRAEEGPRAAGTLVVATVALSGVVGLLAAGNNGLPLNAVGGRKVRDR
jgi:hypothetical protein